MEAMEEKIKKYDDQRTATVIAWLNKIEKSKLTVSDYFKNNNVPFSRSQYYLYKKRFREAGEEGIRDKRGKGGNRKADIEIEFFILGCIAGNPEVNHNWIREELIERYDCDLTLSGLTRLLERINPPERKKRSRGRPGICDHEEVYNSCGGFELIAALAYHLGWPQMTAKIIKDEIQTLIAADVFKAGENCSDRNGRDKQGRFTRRYNQREEIRESRFDSVSDKRQKKNLKSMNIVRDTTETIERKSMAILSLPVVTMNGSTRTVNCALGKELRHFAGFDYKQSTLVKYLSELKYLGVSESLLRNLAAFWNKCWGDEMKGLSSQTLLCYYIDGNTKAVWSSKRVRKNKVSMLGRVMGCLEHVFIHDCFGHPIYFETYSGHAPYGEYVLELFGKIEESIEDVPGSRTIACRAIVMDGAGNSVGTLRSFASQDKYHYITTLDSNQWNERKVNFIKSPSRYKYGDATLREAETELEDSLEKGYLIRSRAIKINWDNGKETVLLTSIPTGVADSSEIVHSYFRRWPSEELQFRSMKAAVSLQRVVGYGKSKTEDKKVLERQSHASKMIEKLKHELSSELEEIGIHEDSIAKLIPEERSLRNQSKIEDGKRVLSSDLMDELKSYAKQISKHEKEIKKIEQADQNKFRLLRKHQQEWLRLQGKETVYKVDTELDQIVTYHRVGLANLYSYFIKYYLGGQPMSMLSLLQKIIHLNAKVKETEEVRQVILDYNEKDERMMEKLEGAVKKLNRQKVTGPQGKQMVFSLKKSSVLN
ncbi:MAG: helix-turn-helix domain-containing protein [Gammaproteobacteria bacterium]|nr:helix-turn-helix domain-containing protein [Gammaproteobacteria bacterium]